MKAILEFNLPEDSHELEMASQGESMYSVLQKMEKWLWAITKHAPDSMSSDTYTAYKSCREKLTELMNDENISFE
jgi:hypothetical protein